MRRRPRGYRSVTRRRTCFPSWRATASRECAPDEMLREAIHFVARKAWIGSLPHFRNDGEPIRTLSSSRRRPGPITTDVSCWMELQPQPRITRTSVVMGPGSRCACPGRRGVCCASSQFEFQTASSKRAFATSRHNAPELCKNLSPPFRGRGECRVPAAPAASCAPLYW
jgi:hypothetical protein